MCAGTIQKWWTTPFCLGLTAFACAYKCPPVMNEGCRCYSQRRSWCQSAAESWTWAPAALDRPAACTALVNSLPWWAPRQTCSFLLNATRPAAGADRLQAPGFWWGWEWMVIFGQCLPDLRPVEQSDVRSGSYGCHLIMLIYRMEQNAHHTVNVVFWILHLVL